MNLFYLIKTHLFMFSLCFVWIAMFNFIVFGRTLCNYVLKSAVQIQSLLLFNIIVGVLVLSLASASPDEIIGTAKRPIPKVSALPYQMLNSAGRFTDT